MKDRGCQDKPSTKRMRMAMTTMRWMMTRAMKVAMIGLGIQRVSLKRRGRLHDTVMMMLLLVMMMMEVPGMLSAMIMIMTMPVLMSW